MSNKFSWEFYEFTSKNFNTGFNHMLLFAAKIKCYFFKAKIYFQKYVKSKVEIRKGIYDSKSRRHSEKKREK